VVGLGDEYGDAFCFRRVEQFPVQLEVRGNRFEVSLDFGDAILFDVEYGAEKKRFYVFCGVLLEVDNVRSGLGEDLRRACDKPFLVGAVDLKNITSHRHTTILKKLGLFTKYFVLL
jgi:hypothetical protein